MIFFNIAAIMVAATGFFGNNTLYGDIAYVKTEDGQSLRSPEDMFNHLILGSEISINVGGLGASWTINWAWITGSIVVAACLIAFFIGDITPLGIGLLTTMFLLMYINSKTIFDQILNHLDSTAGYVGLMIGVGVLMVIVITIMDMATKQKNV
jgi:hypothetical protein